MSNKKYRLRVCVNLGILHLCSNLILLLKAGTCVNAIICTFQFVWNVIPQGVSLYINVYLKSVYRDEHINEYINVNEIARTGHRNSVNFVEDEVYCTITYQFFGSKKGETTNFEFIRCGSTCHIAMIC